MGAKIIALGLKQVCGKPRGAEPVIERKGRRERRRGYAVFDCLYDRTAPCRLVFVEQIAEELVQKEVRETWILVKCRFDVAEETAPMHLLEPARLVRDEGLFRALKFAFNVATHSAARQRVLQMRRVFRKYGRNLTAVAMVAFKPSEKLK